MPIHDWTRVPAGLFHHFHQDWSVEIARTLNRGRLPKGLSALVEKSSLETGGLVSNGATTTTRHSIKKTFAGLANRIVVKRHLGRIVSIIEIVSPGNKDNKAAIRQFLDKTLEFLHGGVHVLVVDLFPPTRRDPHGIHKLIWDEIEEEVFAFPSGKDRILASYRTHERLAYVEPIGIGDILPDMPLFLGDELTIKVPLESTYQATWEAIPKDARTAFPKLSPKLTPGARKVAFPIPSQLTKRVEERKRAKQPKRKHYESEMRRRIRNEADDLMLSHPALRQLSINICEAEDNCSNDDLTQSAPPPPSHARPSVGSRGRRSGR